jgi:hypothetical protein
MKTLELLGWVSPDIRNIEEKIHVTFKLDKMIGEVQAQIEAHDHMVNYHEAQKATYRIGSEPYTWHHAKSLSHESTRDWLHQHFDKLVELQEDLRQALAR